MIILAKKLIKFKQNAQACRNCGILDNILEHEYHVEMDETYNLSNGEGMDIAGQYGVMQTPTILLIDADTKVLLARHSGLDRESLEAILAKRGLI